MIRIAIVEDDFSAAEMIKEYIKLIQNEIKTEVEITHFENGLQFLEKFNCAFDIVLMDIEMPEMNGMDVARQMRQVDNEVCLIFVTNLAKYAIDGYAVDALDFMVKPVSYFQFATKLKRAICFVHKNKQSQIMLTVDKELKRISSKDLLFVEVQKHSLIFYTFEGQFIINNSSMKKVEEDLSPYGFTRCNNCFLVNMKHIGRVQKNSVFIESHELRISNPRKKDFLKTLTNFLSRGGLTADA